MKHQIDRNYNYLQAMLELSKNKYSSQRANPIAFCFQSSKHYTLPVLFILSI